MTHERGHLQPGDAGKRMRHVLGEKAGESITLLRIAHDLKLMNCSFLEFSGPWLTDHKGETTVFPNKEEPTIGGCDNMDLTWF